MNFPPAARGCNMARGPLSVEVAMLSSVLGGTDSQMALRLSGRRLAAALGFAVAGGVAITVGLPAQALSPEDLASLRQEYRRPPPRPVENAALVALGRALFFEPRLSASGTTACASCHFPALGWGMTDAKSRNDSGKLTSRKSQPLIGLGHAGDAPVGWDGRSPTLEAQAKASIETGSMSMRDTDAPVKVEIIVARIRSDPAYAAQFAAALPGLRVDIDAIVTAIAAFERTLEPGPAPFDAWVAGDEAAIPAAAKRGFALFAGQANCLPAMAAGASPTRSSTTSARR